MKRLLILLDRAESIKELSEKLEASINKLQEELNAIVEEDKDEKEFTKNN